MLKRPNKFFSLTPIKRNLPSLWTLFSSVLIVLSFPPWGLSFLLPVCLIPWFYALDQSFTFRERLREGIWLGFFMGVFGFFWIAYVLQEFAMLPGWASLIGLFLFAVINQPQFALYAIFSFRIPPRLSTPLCFALLYTGIDFIVPKLFQDTLGHALYSQPILRQSADLIGAWGLTFVVVWVSFLIFEILKRRKIVWNLSLVCMVAGALSLYGVARRAQVLHHIEKNTSHSINAALIQANIGDFDKVAAENGVRGAADKILETFFSLSDLALQTHPKPDFLVWPETSYPSNFGNPYTYSEKRRDSDLKSYAYQKAVSLFFGGYDFFEGKDHNALFMLQPSNEPESPKLQIYRKSILLLFGEKLPGAELFPQLRRWFPQVGNFGKGPGPQVFEVNFAPSKKAKISPLICYEALFPWFAIQAAHLGSQMLLNITNDSWFGPWGEPQLHLALSTFRSIETRIPQLRGTNTGISALIMPDGSIQQASAIGKPQIIPVSIPIYSPIPTLIKSWGDWFGWFCFSVSTLILIISWLRLWRQPSKL